MRVAWAACPVRNSTLQRLRGHSQPTILHAPYGTRLTPLLLGEAQAGILHLPNLRSSSIYRMGPLDPSGDRCSAMIPAHLTAPRCQSCSCHLRDNHSGPFSRSMNLCPHESPTSRSVAVSVQPVFNRPQAQSRLEGRGHKKRGQPLDYPRIPPP